MSEMIEADVNERAERVTNEYRFAPEPGEHVLHEIVARALQQYGDERTRERDVEIDRLRAVVAFVADNDWAWQGGGSDVRVPGKYAKRARAVLGLPGQFLPGWPARTPPGADEIARAGEVADSWESGDGLAMVELIAQYIDARAREAREAAIEEAAQTAEAEDRSISAIARAIRALAAKPGSEP